MFVSRGYQVVGLFFFVGRDFFVFSHIGENKENKIVDFVAHYLIPTTYDH